VKAICVIAVVLGALGFLSALGGIAGLAFSKQIQTAFSPSNPPGVPQRMVESQKQMQRDLQAIQDRFWPVNAVLVSAQLLLAVGLLFGGIQGLRRVPPARRILIGTCSAAIVFEVVRAVVQTILQVQTMSATMHHMQQMMQSSGDAPPGAMDLAMTISRGAMVVGILFALGIVLLKLVYYGLSVWYLRKPEVQTYLDGDAVIAAELTSSPS
jgi:hypothetical protein